MRPTRSTHLCSSGALIRTHCQPRETRARAAHQVPHICLDARCFIARWFWKSAGYSDRTITRSFTLILSRTADRYPPLAPYARQQASRSLGSHAGHRGPGNGRLSLRADPRRSGPASGQGAGSRDVRRSSPRGRGCPRGSLRASDRRCPHHRARALKPARRRVWRMIPAKTGAALHHDHVLLRRSLDRLRGITDALDDVAIDDTPALIAEANSIVQKQIVEPERKLRCAAGPLECLAAPVRRIPA